MSRWDRNEWVSMEPRRRRLWALALTAEMVAVMAITGWAISRVADDDGPVWACAGLTALWFGSFMACVAVRPTAARTWGLASLVPLALAIVLFAYVTSN